MLFFSADPTDAAHLGEKDIHGPLCCRVFRFDSDFSTVFIPHRGYSELGFPAEKKVGPCSSPSCTDETYKSARTSKLTFTSFLQSLHVALTSTAF